MNVASFDGQNVDVPGENGNPSNDMLKIPNVFSNNEHISMFATSRECKIESDFEKQFTGGVRKLGVSFCSNYVLT